MTMNEPAHAIRSDIERRHLRVRGLVQGVGFRPFVHGLASTLGLTGHVCNSAAGVEIEVQGHPEALHAFERRLPREAPRNARIESIESSACSLHEEEDAFIIAASGSGRAATGIAPDTAVCAHCLEELFSPASRRYRYPFINCTHCGPRYTLTARLPYDRANTSMAEFTLCPPCAHEHDDPADRRFHAQPNACPSCGPEIRLLGADGRSPVTGDPLAETVARLRRGEIVAVKGLGGFHLVCDARNESAVAQLRIRKRREEKPFAVMAANPASLAGLAAVGADDLAILQSCERPVVLLRKTHECDPVFGGVAPGLSWIGVMLPYAPIHYLLFHEAAGRPAGTAWLDEPQPFALVCTSANVGGEPIVTANDEAFTRLAGIADAFLVHDREILVRCDDSVVRALPHAPRRPRPVTPFATVDTKGMAFIRRARGFTPAAIRLPRRGPSVLALGAQLKNTACLTREDAAFLSQHIGDLDNAAACRALEDTHAHLEHVLGVTPEVVACDLHPDFFSSRLAARIADARGIPLVMVQHHHAHIAAVAAEHGIEGPVLGLALDGVGLGTDGTAWGGELLRMDGASFARLGHFMRLPLPGGDHAAREPWRMAAAALHSLGRGHEIPARFADRAEAAPLAWMLESGTNCPPTSSAGRLFDAAAGLLGVLHTANFEGQAPMLLEGLAEAHGAAVPIHSGYAITQDLPFCSGDAGARDAPLQLDFTPLLDHLANERNAARGAAVFHATLIDGLAAWVRAAAIQSGLRDVVLAGGCFLNCILTRGLAARLEDTGLQVHLARQAPSNDGGIALGQAWVCIQGA